MGDPPPTANLARRGSLSLTQTLSLDWAPPPPPADLEQIHASSSQAPGLTSFSLGSPPSGNTEQLSLNKLYSRVKSIAGVVRGVVGSSSSGTPKSLFSSKFGSENYSQQSASRDSFMSNATASDDNSSLRSPNKSSIFSKSHLREYSFTSMHSRSSSRVSSNNSIASTTEYAQPAALRKLTVTPRLTTPAVAQVTVFRDGSEAIYDGGGSVGASRNSSISNLQNLGSNSNNMITGGSGNSTVGALVGAVESVISPTTRFGSGASGNATQALGGGVNLSRSGDFIDADEYFDDSASDETLSESSDDDVVLLHSKLPAGAARGRPPQEGRDRNTRGPNLKPKPRALTASAARRESGTEMPSATSNPATSPDSNMLMSSDCHPPICVTSPSMPVKADSNLPQLSALNLQSKAPSRANLKPPSMARDGRKDAHNRKKRSSDQSLLLPGFKITGDRSSDADSSPAGTSMAGTDQKGEATSSVYRKGAFSDTSSGKMVNYVNAGGVKGSTEAVSQALRQLRMGNLTRDFWMKDEVCKDCFLCGATFSAWRRKHHCRLCGQIFCSKCTNLISGDKFGHQGSMRVCSPCLDIVNDYHDDSDSDDISSSVVFRRPAVDNQKAISTPVEESSSTGYKMPQNLRPGQTPLMAMPATRTTAGSNPNRRSQILEFNDIPSPPRPTSARSIKSFPRPVTAGSTKGLFGTSLLHSHPHSHSNHPHHHKHTRSNHRLSGTPFADERAPFHRSTADEKRRQKLLPTHADSILDPDLAAYMSDEDASDEQQISVFATIAPKVTETAAAPSGADNTGDSIPTLTAKEIPPGGSIGRVQRRSKSRGSINGLGAVLAGSESPGVGNDKTGAPAKRTSRRRGSSFIAPLQQRPVTRGKTRGLMRSLAEGVAGQASNPLPGVPVAPNPRASRSASMRGPLAPNLELNTASLEHVKKLLNQLLSDAEIPNVEQWEKALIPILLKCTDDLNPDIRAGDDIDIRHFVKVKKIPGAKPGDTSYISGVVFSKNLALKSMSRNISQPRIAILTFPIEYSRHQQQLMSLQPVIEQEREFLQNMINRIVALRPTLLLVEKNVSGLALALLAQANVATAYLVKPSVIEAVARCAEADIFSSIDKLALSNFRLGRCASFDVKTFVHNDIPGKKKTFMYLSGCQKELGCTIVLRGADNNTLAIIKQVTELMVYVVYNLKLETCLMRDEYVLIPSSPTGPVAPAATLKRELGAQELPSRLSDLAVADAEETEGTAKKVDTEGRKAGGDITAGLAENTEKDTPEDSQQPQTEETEETAATIPKAPLSVDQLPDDIPNPTYYEDMVRIHEAKILSASPFVSYMQPYLLTRARELERKLVYLRRLRDSLVILEDDEDGEDSDKEDVHPERPEILGPEKAALKDKEKPQDNFLLVDPEAVHGEGEVKRGTSKKANEVLRAIYDAEYDKALHVYETQKKQWENYLAQYDDLFDPFAHQSITVLYSMVCTETTVPCEGPDIRQLEFYYQDHEYEFMRSDCTLGQYIEYLCDTADVTCRSSCGRRMIQHHRSYVHGQARVSVLVSDQIACPIEGMQNTILVWSYCKKCPNTNTPAIPMSESSWKYSFGKYLELAFWSSEMKIRAGNCPHDVNRDHVRCFGHRGFTVLFQHDPIDLLEIVVPRTKITYKPEIDLRVKNDQYTQNEAKIKRFFASVQARLRGINVESASPGKVEVCKAEIEYLVDRARDDEDWLVAKLQEKYNKSKYYEIIPLNRALRALQEKVVDWDANFSAIDSQYFPSEKDIRRLATQYLKKIFLDNTSTSSLQSDNEPTPTQEKEEGARAASVDGVNPSDASPMTQLPSESAPDVLLSTPEAEEEQSNDKDKGTNLRDPAPSGDSTLDEMVSDSTSPRGLEIPDSDVTLKQEARIEPIAPDADALVGQETAFQPPTPEKPSSIPSFIEADRSESESSTRYAKRPSLPDNPRLPQVSAIPRPDASRRRPPAPSFSRTVSVPEVPRRKDLAGPVSVGVGRRSPTMPLKKGTAVGKTTEKIRSEKKLDKSRLSSLTKKPKDKETQSQIPRSIPTTNMNMNLGMSIGIKRPIATPPTRVSSLAKHFEQLSKEFERERAKEKRQLAAKRARALPVATSRPIVEVYKNVREAVEEGSDEDQPPGLAIREVSNLSANSGSTFKTISPVLSPEESMSTPEPDASHLASTPDTLSEPSHMAPLSRSHSDLDADADADASDGEMSMVSDQETMAVPSISDVLPPTADTDVESAQLAAESAQLDLKLGLPQQHRSAWMKMLSKFWAERSASGWTSLEYPLHPTDHVFNDSDIIVREDEPSSLIAFTLNCSDYIQKLRDIRHSDYSHIGNERPTSSEEQVHSHSFNLQEHPELERSLLKTTGTHLKYQFQEGTAKMFCKIFYAEQFDALRRNCGIADRYVESLSRCIKWDSKGGKTRSVFLKTQDERIVLKSLSPVETAAFIKFAPAYFQFMSEAFFHELPTVIAKMLGFYQIMIKNPSTGTEIKWDILVMENLFYDRKTTRIFDLKGSMRNRYTQSTGEKNEVLLDENMVEFIYESPLFVREHSKKLLRVSLHNDTLFLQKQDVMDYSLMIGIDENRKELCVGIIDCIRTFTLDKKLESWVKEKGFAGGGRNKPTITSPKEYKHRFREAMERYVLEAPSCWHLFKMNYVNALPLQLHSAQSAAKGREREVSGQVNEIVAVDGEMAAAQPEDH